MSDAVWDGWSGGDLNILNMCQMNEGVVNGLVKASAVFLTAAV